MTSCLNDRRNRTKRPVAVELFAGAGGMSLGFEQAGFDVAVAVDIDPIHCAVHEFNFPHCAVICGDAAKVSGAQIRKAAGLRDLTVDVVFGGPPCQGFSLIGHRVLNDPRNRLLQEFVRLTVELDAPYFVFENVRGLVIGKHKQLLEELIETFNDNGYEMQVPYRVLNSSEFGVPQDRRRLFLLGAKKGLPLPEYPRSGKELTTVWEAIGDLPSPEDYPELEQNDAVEGAKFSRCSHYARVLRGLIQDPTDFSHPRDWDLRRLTSSLRTVHTRLSQKRFEATEWGKIEPVSRFLKLDPDGISNTLRAGTGSDRGAFTSPRPIHPYAPRCITVREAARLHSYPDWFRFHATKWHGFRQVGNSVPPLLARAVASRVMRALGLKPKRPRKIVRLGDEKLLWLTMSEASARYGVSNGVVGRRLRRDDKRKLTTAWRTSNGEDEQAAV
ncbi:MAG TPA: DNA cytosine methyltransferase [Patescibacteria group bacterium]|nr:DNA cytosine methyltransferase [Patescibacteria group bacterium]